MIAHVETNAPGSRILLISDDAAVARSTERFERKGLHVTIVSKDGAYDAIINSLDEETKEFIRHRNEELLKHVRESEQLIVAAARERPYSPSIFDEFKSKNLSFRSPNHVLGLHPKSVRSVLVYHGIPEFIAGENRYRVSVAVNCDIDLLFRSYFDLGTLFGGASGSPSTIGKDSPVPMHTGSMLTTPSEWEETHETTMYVEGSIDREKYDEGFASGFRLEPDLTNEQRVQLSEYHERHNKD